MIAVGLTMAQILVRELEDSVKSGLKLRAKRNGRSMEAEVRESLRDASREPRATAGFGTASVAFFSGQGVGLEDGEEFKELRGFPLVPNTFDE
jgi:plasmid stability protein